MKRIMYITPHLSTGGLPQYLYKKIKHFINQYEIYCVEWSDITGGKLVVQRNKIKELLGDNLITLYENKNKIFEYIKDTNPDIIHFEEIPETFIDLEILNSLYSNKRNYTIHVTTHSMYTNPSQLRFLADEFILVSEWSKNKFKDQVNGIPCEVWEYPIEKQIYDKNKAKQELNWEPEYKHILHVGLFTPGKNQKYIIELARILTDYKIKFHFVGNQAGNFEDYWKPLMSTLPINCVWHDEQSDVEKYYKAADLFYFPSKFELNPLSVKEALSYNLPLFLTKLETYENVYDDIATYITNNLEEDKKVLLNFFNFDEIKKSLKINLIHLTTENDSRVEITESNLKQLEKFGINYIKHTNKVYEGIAPKEFCLRPNQVSSNNEPKYIGNGFGSITGRHYGCFLAHKRAIEEISEDSTHTIICESDAILNYDVDQIYDIVLKACYAFDKYNTYFISLSNNPSSFLNDIDEYFYETGHNQDLAHCYIIPTKLKNWYLERFKDCEWDGYDLWLNHVFSKYPERRLTTKIEYVKQIEGLSLIDNYTKWTNKTNHYNYIEIGTSDFDTLIEKAPEHYKGISVEPIKEYIDNLPNRKNNIKIQLAISDVSGETDIYYIDPKEIEKNNLPEWVKGCNSIGKPHSSIVSQFSKELLDNVYKSYKIKILSFLDFINRFNIESIDYLKIDTEGHDFTIIKNLLTTDLRPKKISFEANSLYTEDQIQDILNVLNQHNYILIERTSNDITVRLKTQEDITISKKPILVISTGRRIDYLKKTINTLFDKNPNINNELSSVWILDDRSSFEDRFEMDKYLNSKFGDLYQTVHFNSNESFKFVDKFNFIKKIVNKNDVIFLLEDDWECNSPLHLNFHTNNLTNSDYTQIAFCDPLWIQNNDIYAKYILDTNYWKNPFPDYFKHPIRWDGDVCYWNLGRINNWTNNPSLIKAEVFLNNDFANIKNFEYDFAEKLKGNQIFTQEALFRHFGENSLINQL